MNEERVEIIITEWDTIKGADDKQQCGGKLDRKKQLLISIKQNVSGREEKI